jgi:two-component system sensor histidine kinase RegB
MADLHDRMSGPHHFGLSLKALVNLRWLAIAGQASALAIVEWGLDFALPAIPSFAVVGVTVIFNIALRLYYGSTYRLSDKEAGVLLAFDIVQLALLLYLTGGLVNPFSILFLAPVLISAMALTPRTTLMLGGLVVAVSTALAIHAHPLPWRGEPMNLPTVYIVGIWASILVSVAFIGAYAWRVADETRKLSDALTATELVLAREQQISAIDGLAAAAAHELGTPLATIALVVRELERAIPENTPHGADIRLLRQQTERCRTILRTLTSLESGLAPFDKISLEHLIEEVVSPLRGPDTEFEIRLPDDRSREPIVARNPAILYGLESIIENAADFAKEKVLIEATWNEYEVDIAIFDDGPGFAPEILGRIGEPYLRARGQNRLRKAKHDEKDGLGLGFFIAKTLLERGGGALRVANRMAPETGAVVRINWRRDALEHAGNTTAAGAKSASPSSLASGASAH